MHTAFKFANILALLNIQKIGANSLLFLHVAIVVYLMIMQISQKQQKVV